jgi:hypothetical protein
MALALAKLLIPIGLLAAGGTALVVSSKKANASPKLPDSGGSGGGLPPAPSPGGGAAVINPQLLSIMSAALATGDPAVIRRVATDAERAGFPDQAKSLRAAAEEIEKAQKAIDPTKPGGGTAPNPNPAPAPSPAPSPVIPPFVPPPAPSPVPSPVIPPAPVIPDVIPPKPPVPIVVPTKTVRFLTVGKGQGYFQVAQGAKPGGNLQDRMKELRDRNVPVDADGRRRQAASFTDPKFFGSNPHLNAGEHLFVPESWPNGPGMQTKEVTILSGDTDSIGDDDVRRLAGRVALEVNSKNKGSENRELIGTFQRVARERGHFDAPVNGLYNAHTIVALVRLCGICPPLAFGDGGTPYWPRNHAPARNAVRQVLTNHAERDPSRSEEFAQAAERV